MTIILLLVALVLLVVNGFFVGAEVAITAAAASRRGELERRAADGRRSARLAVASMRELSFMLTGAQLGITMASLGLGFVAEPAIADVLEEAFADRIGLTGAPLHALASVIALTIVVVFHMVLGEMAPKNIAIAEPVRTLLYLALPYRLYANAVRGLLWVLNELANLTIRAVGVAPRDELERAYTPAQIGSMLGELRRLGAISAPQQQLADRALRFASRPVEEVMAPRSAVHALPAGMSVREIERQAVATGHSRFPVYRDTPDNIVGFIHVKDLLAIDPAVMDQPLPDAAIRPLHVTPATALVGELLVAMRRQRAHMALVVDEHGSPAGIVTLEDLVEEVVGEIRDEHDAPLEDVQQFGPDRFVVAGTLRTDRLAEATGCHLPAGDFATVAGYVMHRLGAVPKPGDAVEHDGWILRVRRMRGPRLEMVDVIRRPAAGAPSDPVGPR